VPPEKKAQVTKLKNLLADADALALIRRVTNPRLLEADNRLVVPVGATVRTLVAGADVMHSFFVPSLGVQIYSVPGRLNETWFQVEKEGIYYGQCNQICGTDHAYMPIAVEAVSKAKFQQWLEEAKKKFAAAEPAQPVRVAAAD
jgi:cytochrome c oxidase subunit 2